MDWADAVRLAALRLAEHQSAGGRQRDITFVSLVAFFSFSFI